jgi:hypothetical protein
MPLAVADAAAGKAAATHTLPFAASTISSFEPHPSHGKKQNASSHNQNATTEVDAINRCDSFPAAHCQRPGVRARKRHQATTLRT